MLQNPDLCAYAEIHHKEHAPTYTRDRVCLMGDAAHAMTPWQGAGAGQAIEDAMILDTLLGEIRHPSQLPAAFKAYDQVRRSRTQRIVESSYGTGLILSGRGEGTGLDIEKIRKVLPERWTFIYSFDPAEHKEEALAAFRALV